MPSAVALSTCPKTGNQRHGVHDRRQKSSAGQISIFRHTDNPAKTDTDGVEWLIGVCQRHYFSSSDM